MGRVKFLTRLFLSKDTRVLALIAEADRARDRTDWSLAQVLYRKVLDEAPRRAGVWVQYGHALKEDGVLEAAREAYQAAIDLRPELADTHVQMGHLLRLQGQVGEAAQAYVRAVQLDAANRAALEELRDLQRRGVVFDHRAASDALVWAERLWSRIEPLKSARVTLVFDLGDLIGYARESRRPTGIQRVQIAIVSALLSRPNPHRAIDLCAFNAHRGDWIGLPPSLFQALTRAMLDTAISETGEEGLDDETCWRALVNQVSDLFDFGAARSFRTGETLVNLGTSWSTPDYFLHLRRIKADAAIRYVPFVHDMIPVMVPEHCVPMLVAEFADWIAQAFDHADAFLTNSRSSAADLTAAAACLGHVLSPNRIGLMPLGADPGATTAAPDRTVLKRMGLSPDAYVLFVSTIESRKNHVAAIQAWAALVERNGAAGTLPLICVGKAGWLNAEIYAELAARPELAKLVRFVGAVSDAALAALYDGCAFFFYPSRYEGWGLPVTEALCHGKAVLTSDASSLPEVGGDFAQRFRLDDPTDLVDQLDRIMHDAALRRCLESRVAADFRPRTWDEIASNLVAQLDTWGLEAPRPAPEPPQIKPERAFLLRTSPDHTLFPGRAELERFRSDSGWWPLDAEGVWTREGGGAIRGPAPPEGGDLVLEVELRSPPWPADWKLSIDGGPSLLGHLEPGADAVVSLVAPEETRRDGSLGFRLTGGVGIVSEIGDNRQFGVGLKAFALSRPGETSSFHTTPSPR